MGQFYMNTIDVSDVIHVRSRATSREVEFHGDALRKRVHQNMQETVEKMVAERLGEPFVWVANVSHKITEEESFVYGTDVIVFSIDVHLVPTEITPVLNMEKLKRRLPTGSEI